MAEKKHDTFALGRLRQWWNDANSEKTDVLVKSEL
jgi:hypothetical protein